MKGKLEDGYNKLKAVQKYIEENIKNKIQFINYNSGEIEIVTKLMKKYHKQGFKMAVFDTIYPATPFLRAAARQGHPVADGRGMLLHQGAKSFEIWTGEPAPVEVMRQALERSLQK